ncbi:F-box/kelch-repeat protein At3g06240-like [Papaver somniferum]|uniref:F-box/kelch-repeat protein At3g06240-like n=1 Tax=Papaver somniferum TaxID=3469 RepID=UPI000E6FE2D2|nr:F-box/kelch-repeat protein At3g06240-like [Papaver somniferum]
MSTFSSRLPEEFDHEILSRLPAKSVFVCKCVCKTWLSVISNPTFIQSHLNVTVKNNNPSLMLAGYEDSESATSAVHSIKHDLLSEFDGIGVNEMDYPFKSSASNIKLVGSYNGLVCIRIDNDFYCIWNPVTYEYKRLPETPNVNNYEEEDVETYGLGYDCKTDDYKLVIVVDDLSLVEVYTLGSNSWDSIRTVPYRFYGGSGVLISGALHWLGARRGNPSSDLVISFEINSEKFNELQLPKEPLEDNCRWFSAVGVLEGCLCVLALDKNTGSPAEVWVMRDYGVRESWTKITTVTGGTVEYPLMSLKNDKILFWSFQGIPVLHDRKDGSSSHLNVCSPVDYTSALNYFETLVSLNSAT